MSAGSSQGKHKEIGAVEAYAALNRAIVQLERTSSFTSNLYD
jgi:hypothetical protein